MKTREEWLQGAVSLMRPFVKDSAGLTIPKVAVSVGFPYGRRARHAIGQCHYNTVDKKPALFIHPGIDNPVQVLDILLHETLHAALPVGTSHKAPFARAAKACGLEGKPTATVASEALVKEVLVGWNASLGRYPHARVDTSDIPRQTTRMLKVQCFRCGYTVRTTAKWLEFGTPTCPCGEEMEEA